MAFVKSASQAIDFAIVNTALTLAERQGFSSTNKEFH